MTSTSPSTPAIPLVVQVAFAGKRRLLDPADHPTVDPAAFRAALGALLTERMRRLPSELGLSTQHEVCALSSLAAGGDLLFTQTCQQLGWRQRIFLPQAREAFLAASGSDGPDFVSSDASEARRLLESPHVIEECVASVSTDRTTRFEDVNLELVRECDLLVCVSSADAPNAKAAGTEETLALAHRWQRPVLELQLGVNEDGTPRLTDSGLWPPPRTRSPSTGPNQLPHFSAPTLPAPLDAMKCADCGFLDSAAYRKALKDFASGAAAKLQNRFRWAALIIVGLHVLATVLALLASKVDPIAHPKIALIGQLELDSTYVLISLLGIELSFLASGLAYHKWLHHSQAARDWAMARLIAEVARSASPLAAVPRALRHMRELPMPDALRPLLRTLYVLQLAGLREIAGSWEERRRAYVQERLRSQRTGQIHYYVHKLAQARRWIGFARGVFYAASAGAFLATGAKLLMVYSLWLPDAADPKIAAAAAGFLAVLLPVIAVAALSLAAAFDLEARVHTYRDILEFLNEQVRLLEVAASENEFASLALQTESRLLGETAHWHARRTFTGVA